MISYYQFKKICDKLIVAMPLPKQGGKKICGKVIVAMALPKQGEKKNCENLIVAMPLPKQGNKKKNLAIVAMALPKMGGSYEIYERVKKKKLSCPQYFYNIFTINHT